MEQNQPFVVGIDVSKNHLDVHALPTGAKFRINLDQDPEIKGLRAFFHQSREHGYIIDRVVLEATGGYETPCVLLLAEEDIPVVIANPRQVRNFAKALGRLSKTDKVDAQIIAEYAQKVRPEPRALPSKEQRLLRGLVARRRQLLQDRVREDNRLKIASSPSIKESIERHLDFLNEELDAIDEHIESVFLEDPELQERADLLQTAKGIGETTARALVVYLPELGRLDRKQVASMAGLAPWSKDSGEMLGRRSIWGGRATVRTSLYMAAISATRYNPQIRSMYERLVSRGKPKKLALIACARKLLVILNAMVRENTPYKEKKCALYP